MARRSTLRKRHAVIRPSRKKKRPAKAKKAKPSTLRLLPMDTPLLVFIGRKDLLSPEQRKLWR